MSLNHIQEAQEKEYAFPYHHIARFKDEFSWASCMWLRLIAII